MANIIPTNVTSTMLTNELLYSTHRFIIDHITIDITITCYYCHQSIGQNKKALMH